MFTASRAIELAKQPQSLSQWMDMISDNYIVDESSYLAELLQLAKQDGSEIAPSAQKAVELVKKIRQSDDAKDGVEAFLQQYSLETKEGVVLMCLAEALLRIPDADVSNKLIKDKLGTADWKQHVGQSDSLLVNASTWGLLLTGGIVGLDAKKDGSPANILNRMINRVGEPVIRTGVNQAMKFMGKQFVLGRTIQEAMKRGLKSETKGFTHSYDMLGEAALTTADAQRYFEAYKQAISQIGEAKKSDKVPTPSISIKLSALHPRYETHNHARVMSELGETLSQLVQHARSLNVPVTIDAEEADRLEISLELFEKVFSSDICADWPYFGLVVQAYSKRALPVLGWLNQLSRDHNRQIPVRLVKGAYWDSEIKWCQQAGTASYPVFTRKSATDVSYIACARFMLENTEAFYPQFATHNAHTVCAILEMHNQLENFEFQRLHGMGEALYNAVLESNPGVNCRIYAPVGAHKDLLPYLVRRLLENGANTSFVHKLVDEKVAPESLCKHPIDTLEGFASLANDRIPLPPQIFGESRENSAGCNLHIYSEEKPFMNKVAQFLNNQWHVTPIINGEAISGEAKTVTNPTDKNKPVGTTVNAGEATILKALDVAHNNFIAWDETPAMQRAAILDKAADLLEANKHELIAICTLEAGKIMEDGIDEVREAIDFCRYYAAQGRQDFGAPLVMPGPTGESNELRLQGRGVFACIAPWNFPLAIFLGQVTAALVAGNTVIAKPAAQTTVVAHRAVELLFEAGLPKGVLQFLPSSGRVIGELLLPDPRIAGVAFTGSTDTAMTINRTLCARNAAIAPLIAETGGQNAMIVDSSALPEQVINDVVMSAFKSAGQRCSALRVMYVQEDVADRMLELLKGAMAELTVGDPAQLNTDVGPVIDFSAKEELEAHIETMRAEGKLIYQTEVNADTCVDGSFVAPTAANIESINDLKQEFFGPILHVIRYKSKDLDKVINEINAYGYGLTLGIHSRIEATSEYITKKARVGNVYINRNMIGAAVGVQPFGGQGLSGTGPKAGGPRYLHRFATEQTTTNNTAAVGGNATLLSLGDGE
jgi:RHH-type transcriptional regulator, proline utilization regulon repressor / proline dehydrogenase / delta 1-pyrroline-5-carboxylate dehydrogenase